MAYEQLPSTCEKLQDLGLELVSIVTLRLCTLFLKVGIADLGLPFRSLATLMQRSYDEPDELTWLQKQVQACAEAVGTPCRVETAPRGENELVVDSDAAQSLDIDTFLHELGAIFKAHLPDACACLKSP